MDPVFDEWGQMGWVLVTSVPCGAEGLREYIFKRSRELPSDIVFTSDLKKPPRKISAAVQLRHRSYH